MNKGHDKGHKGQMSDREVMRLALEALENWMRIDTVEDMHIFEMVTAPEAITALRQALEQEPWDTTDMAHRAGGLSMEQEGIVPSDYSSQAGDYSSQAGDCLEQEPVAWVKDLTSAQPRCVTDLKYISVADTEAGVQYIPLYTAPPKESEQEPPTAADLLCVCGAGWEWRNRDWELVETPPKQEPAAYITGEYKGYFTIEQTNKSFVLTQSMNLYTAPPKREWVALTDEEIFDVIRSLCADNETAEMLIHVSMDEYRAIEAKLKEKNK